MQIFGKDVHFFLSVGARFSISKLSDSLGNYLKTAGAMAIMSEAYEERKRLEDPEYKPNPVTIDEIQALTDEEFRQLCEEFDAAVEAGNKRTVEAEEDKKKEPGASN